MAEVTNLAAPVTPSSDDDVLIGMANYDLRSKVSMVDWSLDRFFCSSLEYNDPPRARKKRYLYFRGQKKVSGQNLTKWFLIQSFSTNTFQSTTGSAKEASREKLQLFSKISLVLAGILGTLMTSMFIWVSRGQII